MKILLVAVDTKFIHTNLAVHSIRAYSGKYKNHIHVAQYSINHMKDDILRGIYLHKADVVAFSCYIWNIRIIESVMEDLKRVQPQVKIWFGGPEVTYYPEESLLKYNSLDGIIIGEGEQTFCEVMEYYLGIRTELDTINGIAFKDSARLFGADDKSADAIMITPFRKILPLDDIPFAYEDMQEHQNKIIYYESSRGCPYSCSYCLSSANIGLSSAGIGLSSARRGVRYRSMELIKKELGIFLEYKVPQVKFIDRTFNCNKEHALAIWQFIKEHDNGITNFHFEITGDLLNEEELSLLESLRPGLVQLEIGVQTTNPDTMEAIRRKVDFERLAENVKRIKKAHNIHQHLDLIAGLPLEDYHSFEKSFYDVYMLKPDQLQLGFLKVLKGSIMEGECEKYGIAYKNEPPYEVLFTKHLSYDEVLELKGICEMVEVYYNSGQFAYSIKYLEHYFETSMRLYAFIYHYYMKKGLYTLAHSRMRRYEILFEAFLDRIGTDENQMNVFRELLVFDLCLREELKNRPEYAGEPIPYRRYREICEEQKLDRHKIHIEQFAHDVIESAKTGKAVKKDGTILFDYGRRDPITYSAKTIIL